MLRCGVVSYGVLYCGAARCAASRCCHVMRRGAWRGVLARELLRCGAVGYVALGRDAAWGVASWRVVLCSVVSRGAMCCNETR